MSEPVAHSAELIRAKPRWIARLANRMFRWTDMYCAGDCGYPVTGTYSSVIDTIKEVPILVVVCESAGECRRNATSDPRDESGRPYYEFRPLLVSVIEDMGESKPDNIKISFSA